MKIVTIIFSILLMSCLGFTQSESKLPPPPMPAYMKKHRITNPPPAPGVKEKLQHKDMGAIQEVPKKETKFLENLNQENKVFSKTEDGFNNQSADSVKEEFLQAGEEGQKEAPQADGSTPKAPLESLADAAEEDESNIPTVEVAERAQPTEEVNEVDVAESEFEQAAMGDDKIENATNQYLTDSGNEVTAPELSEESEKLAEVEEQLESAEQDAEEKLQQARKPTSSKFKAGMYKLTKNCTMYSEASNMSQPQGSVRSGRKLWIDAHSSDWHKVYKKAGAVFIPANCLK